MNGAMVFLRGTVLGFSIAAPVGPIGILCIRQTLADGSAVGLATGLGAAAADGLYGALAAFGLTWITAALVAQQLWIRLVGGAFASTFALTITNPMTILSFLAVFAGLGLGATGAGANFALPLVAGVVTGSAAWWLLLSAMVGRLRSRFDMRGLAWVNRISGALITGFGVLAVLSTLGTGSAGVRAQ